MEIIVVGGGVIGLSVAWELASRGAKVRLLERGSLGGGTSWAAAGILPAAQPPDWRPEAAADPLDALRGYSHEIYPQWAQRIADLTGIDVGLRRCGGLYLASTPGEAAALVAGLEYWRGDGIAATRLSPTELGQWEPALSPWALSARFRAAVRVDDERQVRPPDLLRGLAAASSAAGVQIDEHVHLHVERRGDAAVLRLLGDGHPPDSCPDQRIVLCGGVWSGLVAQDFGLEMSMVPIRGQMLLYRFAAPPFRHIINEGHRYLVPRDDGHVLVGSCEEEVGFTAGTTPQMIDTLAQWASGLVPELRSMTPLRTWSGLRPATFDGFPIIGGMPEVENLFVAAGHYRSGIHLAPATAVLVADLIERKPTRVDPRAFGVGRMLLQPSGPGVHTAR